MRRLVGGNVRRIRQKKGLTQEQLLTSTLRAEPRTIGGDWTKLKVTIRRIVRELLLRSSWIKALKKPTSKPVKLRLLDGPLFKTRRNSASRSALVRVRTSEKEAARSQS